MDEYKILSAMAVPLVVGQRALGLIYVDDRGRSNRFSDQDLDFLDALARVTAAALENAQRYQWAAVAAEGLSAERPLRELVGESAAMQRLKNDIRKYAASSAHVLIHGESGTGKELVAQTIHALSPRAKAPFITLNCAAMPETMIEAELFGHVKGAFTGAMSNKKGKFVLADHGSLFLDEIGDLSPAAQAKVLRAVQEGEVQPLGSEKTLRVNVRLVSATHKDLAAEVAAGRFREDLFYRLHVLVVEVPPLRERAEDIHTLAQMFLTQFALKVGKRAVFTEAALAALARYRFPGNVRELRNEAERAALSVEGGGGGAEPAAVDVGDLSPKVVGAKSVEAGAPTSRPRPRPRASSLEEQFAELERREEALVMRALEGAGGNVAEAGRALGITRVMMKIRMKRFGIEERKRKGTDPGEE